MNYSMPQVSPPKNRRVIVSAILPGKIYNVPRGTFMHGESLKCGYDSHRGQCSYCHNEDCFEYVIFCYEQMMPLFIVTLGHPNDHPLIST